ncbi:MAG: peptidylprolyl isomerase [Candidatus Marinimicrobia bacterium]|nr:peptidylprolyl isomerase [Candidatus Neomarinimicrobiota bacterium]MCF7830009.1 peptidylprolyl isomerase [Candidatus Neomarinimicrobiota bacterium]MCF7881949.1 peptidylprolyl isomerase [Candidatus Neomarinimicrobiota bacterium]
MALLWTCGDEQETEFSELNQTQIDSIKQVVKNAPRPQVAENEVGVIETNHGTIVIRFFPDVAPKHTANFKMLAQEGYFDGTWFHRVIPGFMIQGGDILSRDGNPSNDGTGGPGFSIPAEFNRKPHYRGRLSMARSRDPNSAGSQFFIVQNPKLTEDQIYNAEMRLDYEYPDSVVQKYLEKGGYPGLDNQYTVFGEVIQGMDVVDKIANLPTDERDHPNEKAIMTNVYFTDRDNVDL